MISIKLEQKTQQRLCLVLATVLLGLFIAYIYLISASIVHVVMRTELNQEIQRVSSEISLLESRYIAAQHNVSESIASLEGYAENSDKIFIDRSAPRFVYSGEVTR